MRKIFSNIFKRPETPTLYRIVHDIEFVSLDSKYTI